MAHVYCAVKDCKSQRNNKELSFFSLPKEKERRNKWLKQIGRLDLMNDRTKPKSYSVCSLHFEESMITYTPQLKSFAIPTKLCPNNNQKSDSDTETIEAKEMSTQTEDSYVRKILAVKEKTEQIETRTSKKRKHSVRNKSDR